MYSGDMKTLIAKLIRSAILGAVLSALVQMLAASPANAADSGACYAVTDSDQRAYCLAKAHKDSSRCYSIRDNRLRSVCLAEVRG